MYVLTELELIVDFSIIRRAELTCELGSANYVEHLV